MLKPWLIEGRLEAGCDEAGRGPLAGPVVAAAVLLPRDYENSVLNDSKQLTERQRDSLRLEIEREAEAWAVASLDAAEVDRLNILRASTHAMCLAVMALLGNADPCVASGGKSLGRLIPEHILVDGNRFYNETPLPFTTVVKGDARLMPIAAASVLAKTHRDEQMAALHSEYPCYGWDHNKGYPTASHYDAIERHGPSPYHRRSFNLYKQHSLFE
ncbi:MAG: ribonuclease HII [Bacteroidales bacterium]|nr:ribonuclease HII [Bacteroidales bacterium]